MLSTRRTQRYELEDTTKRLAVLIDADNAQASIFDALLEEVATFGEAIVKRIYGDFTSPQSANWKKVLQRHAIKPMQQFAYTTGKNATDSSLIIDAMDLMHTGKFDGFCIVSSDSDFTGLAMRLREEGLTVLGFGEKKTPEAFRKACNRFVLTEVLRPKADHEPVVAAPTKKASAIQPPTLEVAKPKEPIPRQFLLSALEQAIDDSGWAGLGAFGSYLYQVKPDFDARTYGFKKLSDLVKANSDIFSVDERVIQGTSNTAIYVRAASIRR